MCIIYITGILFIPCLPAIAPDAKLLIIAATPKNKSIILTYPVVIDNWSYNIGVK